MFTAAGCLSLSVRHLRAEAMLQVSVTKSSGVLGVALGSLFPLLTDKPWTQTLQGALLHSSCQKAVRKGNARACRLADSRSGLKVMVLVVQDQGTLLINEHLRKGKRK